jgi:hypothetical protein
MGNGRAFACLGGEVVFVSECLPWKDPVKERSSSSSSFCSLLLDDDVKKPFILSFNMEV